MYALCIPCASPRRPRLAVLPGTPAARACEDYCILLGLLTVNCRLLTRLSPLECAVPSKHRVLPGFGRSCPSVTSLECAVPKKGGGRVLAQDFLGAYQMN